MKDDFAMLKHAFISKTAPSLRQNNILRDHGVWWAAFNILSDWLPSSKSARDFMHNIYLGLVHHLFMEVIFKGYMLSGSGGSNSQKQRFEKIINSIRWPSHVTRLPRNVRMNDFYYQPSSLHRSSHSLAKINR